MATIRVEKIDDQLKREAWKRAIDTGKNLQQYVIDLIKADIYGKQK